MRTTYRKPHRITSWIAALVIFWTVFVPGIDASAVSSDVPSVWAQDEVDAARTKGLIIAEADQNYKSNISRRLFCALVVNLVETVLGQPVTVTVANPFEDTNEIDIIKAYQLGIVKGVSATRFAPDEFITREQIAVMMMCGARELDELKGSTYANVPDVTTITFADQSDISYWALRDVQTARRLGIILGVGGNRINPKGNTTVEQSILLINRLYDGFTGFMESSGTSTGDTGTSTGDTGTSTGDTGTSVNQPPGAISNPAVFSVPEQTSLTISASQLALDPDGDALEIVEVTGSCSFGAAELTSDGKCRYISNDIVSHNTDEFCVMVSDGQNSVRITVKVNIEASSPANNRPVAISNPVVFSVQEQTPLAIAASQLALDPDGDGLSIVRVNGQTANYNTLNGTVFLAADGRCTYTSNNVAANVTDDFPVTVSDGTNETQVNVRVKVTCAPELNLNLNPAVASVTVNGTAALGETLSAGMIRYAGLAPGTAPQLAYQWMRSSSLNGPYSNIPGATNATYVLTQSDIGKYIKLKVTASGSATGSAVSAAKGPVGKFSGGDGTASNPYQISNAEQFMLLNDTNMPTAEKHFKLTSDIALGDNEYIEIPFYGTLDGNGKKITLSIRFPDDEQIVGIGLFKTVAASGTVKNLSVAGKIVAKNEMAGRAGSIAGSNYGSIIKCFSTTDIVTGSGSGGITGRNGGTLKQCGVDSHGIGNGEPSANITGGLVGWNLETGKIENCFSRAPVYGGSNVGGLIGLNCGDVKYSYSTGKVNGNSQTGGFIGQNDGGTASYCYYDMETSGKKDSGWGYVPRTTAQMKLMQNYVGWDFAHIWSMAAGQYPELRQD